MKTLLAVLLSLFLASSVFCTELPKGLAERRTEAKQLMSEILKHEDSADTKWRKKICYSDKQIKFLLSTLPINQRENVRKTKNVLEKCNRNKSVRRERSY